MNNPHPEAIHISCLSGTAVDNADAEFVGTAKDLLVNTDGNITAMLLDTGGILGVGEKTIIVPFSECAIERHETAFIVFPHLHYGEVLVAPEYQGPGGTRFERIANHTSALGRAAMIKAGELSEQAAEKASGFRQKAVDIATGLPHNGADKVTELVHKYDKR